jgi:hypothetical protein
MAILGSKYHFWPFCDFWTVQSCTVMTVPKLQYDGLTPSFTASTVRQYFDRLYCHHHCTALTPILLKIWVFNMTTQYMRPLYYNAPFRFAWRVRLEGVG